MRGGTSNPNAVKDRNKLQHITKEDSLHNKPYVSKVFLRHILIDTSTVVIIFSCEVIVNEKLG